MPQPGDVPAMVGMPGDTSYACAVDAKGNVMSVTPSDSSWDGPVIPGLGFVPSTRGSQSFTNPSTPPARALRQRPRLTPNPWRSLVAARPGSCPFGSPGGDLQPQAMLQVFP